MITVEVDLDGLARKVNTVALLTRDLDEPLKHFGMYMRRKALATWEAQAFPPLAESTLEKRTGKALHSLERKLSGDVRKAQRRAGKGIADAFLAAHAASKARGVLNRISVLAEFQRQHRHMWKGRDLMERADLKPLTVKQMASLGERTKRALTKAADKPILGYWPKALRVVVGDGNVTLIAKTQNQWSEVHNEGGTAGHGARIPKRETIPQELDAHDVAVLTSILKTYLLVPLDDDKLGPGF